MINDCFAAVGAGFTQKLSSILEWKRCFNPLQSGDLPGL